MRVGVVGPGAMGGYYGAMLAHNGYDVHFLMRSDYPVVKENGLLVRSYKGDFHLAKVNCYDTPSRVGRVDVVFVGLKTTANHRYRELIEPMAGAETLILTAQNGLGNEEELAEIFGRERIAGGLAFICCNREQPGVINHLDYGYIHIGNFQRAADEKLKSFARMLSESGVESQVVDDLALAHWKKLVWNVPFNGLSALHDKTVDKIMADESQRVSARRLMQEVQAAAKTQGLIIEDEFLDKMMDDTQRMKPYYTSMHLDRRRGRPMEIESIIGEPLRSGQKAGLAMTEMQNLYEQLKRVEQANTR